MAEAFSAEKMKQDYKGCSEKEIARELLAETNAYSVYSAMENTFDSNRVYVRCNSVEDDREFRHSPEFKRTHILISREMAAKQKPPPPPDPSKPPPIPARGKEIFPDVSQQDLIRSLVAIVRTDGRIGMRERRFLDNICKHFSIPQEILQAGLAHAEEGSIEIRLPNNSKGRSALLTAMIAAAGVDNNVTSDEWKILEVVVGKMGVSKTSLHAAIQNFLQRRSKPQ